jgi:hypothetical protein
MSLGFCARLLAGRSVFDVKFAGAAMRYQKAINVGASVVSDDRL